MPVMTFPPRKRGRPPKYDADTKMLALGRVAGGEQARTVAGDLGIPVKTLESWIYRIQQAHKAEGPGETRA